MFETLVMIAAVDSAAEIDSSFFSSIGFQFTPEVIDPSFVEGEVYGTDYKRVFLGRLEDLLPNCKKSNLPVYAIFDMNQMHNRITDIGFRDLVTKTVSLGIGVVVICGEEWKFYLGLLQSIQRTWPNLYT